MYSYPVMKIPQMSADARRGRLLRDERAATAHPVPMTMVVAAASPQRMRLVFPRFASCSWKNGLDTVNQLGQKPANTPDASPMSMTMTVMSSRVMGRSFLRVVCLVGVFTIVVMLLLVSCVGGVGACGCRLRCCIRSGLVRGCWGLWGRRRGRVR
jgi:hypothetical protein